MVSSRDRNCQRIEMTREVIARAPPPAFLFPNQQCQRPRAEAPRTTSRRNHPFSARCRRRRLSIQPRIPCQTVFYKTVRTNPPNPPKSKSSRPWRPSSEERQSSQEENPKMNSLDLVKTRSNSCELFPNPPEPRFLRKAKPLVNRPFSLSSMSWPRPLRRTKARRRSP